MVKPVANRPSSDPAREEEDIAAFQGCAPGLPIHKLGGGLMKECINLEIRNGRLRSRDKLRLFHGNGNMPDFPSAGLTVRRKFFTIPYGGAERKYWIYCSRSSMGLGGITIYWLDGSNSWVKLCDIGRLSRPDSLDGFHAFRLNNLYDTDLWVLAFCVDGSLVLDNKAIPMVRELGMPNVPGMKGFAFNAEGAHCRAFGFDYAEMRDGVPIRSSGAMKLIGLDGLSNQIIEVTLHRQTPAGATHVRLWLSDKLEYDVRDAGTDKLYPVLDMELGELQNAAAGNLIADCRAGWNGFKFSIMKKTGTEYRIMFFDSGEECVEPSQSGVEATTMETMNLVPMPNAQCLSGGTLFGVKDGADGVVMYSSNQGTIYQEQTNALRALQTGVGSIIGLAPASGGVLAVGTNGVARVARIGNDEFASSKIASLDLSGMRCLALPGLGAACMGRGRMLFIDEGAFEAGETFLGMPLGDMLGHLAKDVQAMEIADGKVCIIAGDGSGSVQGNRLFRIDLGSAALVEMKIQNYIDCHPVDLFSHGSEMLFSCMLAPYGSSSSKDPVILSSAQGAEFETALGYEAAFCESSAYGFIQHSGTQALARLGRCATMEASVGESEFIPPLRFDAARNASEYQGYSIPAVDGGESGGGRRRAANAVAVRLRFHTGAASGENDGLEILSVRLSRIRQGDVSSPGFNIAWRA